MMTTLNIIKIFADLLTCCVYCYINDLNNIIFVSSYFVCISITSHIIPCTVVAMNSLDEVKLDYQVSKCMFCYNVVDVIIYNNINNSNDI